MDYDDDDDSELFDEEELRAFAARHGFVEDDAEEDEDDRLLQSVQEQVCNIFKASSQAEDTDDDESLLQSVRESCRVEGNTPAGTVVDVGNWEQTDDRFGLDPGKCSQPQQLDDTDSFPWKALDRFETGDEAFQEIQGLDEHNVHLLQHGLEKNKACQALLRGLLLRVEARKRENQELQKRVKAMESFEKFCQRRAFSVQGSDARFVSFLASLSTGKQKSLITGPEKNKDVDGFLKLHNSVRSVFKRWSEKESRVLREAVRAQVQQHLIFQAMEASLYSDELEQELEKRHEEINRISDAEVKNLIQVVNWETIASSSLPGRTANECKSRWMNHEDPLINHGPWSKAEDLQLLSIAKGHGFSNWGAVAEAMGSYRTAAQCLTRYQRSLNATLLIRKWSREDDEELRRAVELYGDKDWESVAACVEGRSGAQVMQRWSVLQNSEKKQGRWSVEEDQRLHWAVLICGAQQWKKIAELVSGRSAVQCRERWKNVLDPELVHGEWRFEEDEKLEEAVGKLGEHRWASVAEVMKPRTDNQCWRRWMALHPESKDKFHKEVVMKKKLVPTFGKRKKDRPGLDPGEILSAQSNKKQRTCSGEEGEKDCSPAPAPAPAPAPVRRKAKRKDGGRRRTVDLKVRFPGEKVDGEDSKLSRVARMEKLKVSKVSRVLAGSISHAPVDSATEEQSGEIVDSVSQSIASASAVVHEAQ